MPRNDPERSGTETTEVVVVGAGQAGLACGYHLVQRGIDHVVLDEQERIGDVWRRRWDSLRLFTPGRYDGLPGMPFPGPAGAYPSKDDMADYLETYASACELQVRTSVRVERVSPIDEGFEVIHGTGRIQTANVIVATGAHHHPRIPDFADDLDEGVVHMHSREYRRPEQLPAGPVLVVGAGNSGAEIALELAADHQVWLSGPDTGEEPTRAGSVPDRLLTPLMWFVAHRALKVTNPLGRKVRDHFIDPPRGIPLGRVRRMDLTAAGVETVPRTTGVEDGQPVLEDGRVVAATSVIWGTGFVLDYGWLDVPVFGEHGFPDHERGVVDSAPGLYFMGLPFQYALSSALVGGVARDAAHVVAHLSTSRVSHSSSGTAVVGRS